MARTSQQIDAEIESVDDYLTRILGIEPDAEQATRIATELVKYKVDDYLTQRWRDWPVADLLALVAALGKRQEARAREAKAKRRVSTPSSITEPGTLA